MFLTFQKTYVRNNSFLCKHGCYMSPEWIEFTKNCNDILVTSEREREREREREALDFIGFLILFYFSYNKQRNKQIVHAWL